MKPYVKLDVKEVKEFLLEIALIKSVFIWGPPGIGKSSVINQFSNEVGLECVPLLGSQLAPEDLISSDAVFRILAVTGFLGNASKKLPFATKTL